MAVPASRPPSAATISSALGELEKAPQAAPRQPVGGEDRPLKLGQRVEVAALGFARADLGEASMSEMGGHRHQRGAPGYQLRRPPAPRAAGGGCQGAPDAGEAGRDCGVA